MRTLVSRLDSDGDVLLAGPAVRAVAAGSDHVTLLCSPRGRQAAGLLPGVDDVLVWDCPWISPEPPPATAAGVVELVAELGRRRFDRAVILGSFHQSPLPTALLLRMAGVPFVGATSVDYPGSLLDVRHRIADDVHEVERALACAEACGFALPQGDDGALRVHADPAGAALAGDGPFVVVHPGADAPARAWAPERCAQLVDALAAAGRRVVVTGGPGERELTALVAGTAGLDLGGRTSLGELAGLLAAAACVVVGNTGPAHLAAAVGTPVVSLFAPVVPAVRWHPWQVRHELLHRDVPCAGCRARTCPVPGHPCLGDLELSEVLGAVDRLAPDREVLCAS